MFQIVAKAFSSLIGFVISHKFSCQIAFIGTIGITLPELIFADHAVKVLVGMATLFVLGDKWLKDRKKRKNGNF